MSHNSGLQQRHSWRVRAASLHRICVDTQSAQNRCSRQQTKQNHIPSRHWPSRSPSFLPHPITAQRTSAYLQFGRHRCRAAWTVDSQHLPTTAFSFTPSLPPPPYSLLQAALLLPWARIPLTQLAILTTRAVCASGGLRTPCRQPEVQRTFAGLQRVGTQASHSTFAAAV